jgi:Domain of unknown function (DUF1906)
MTVIDTNTNCSAALETLRQHGVTAVGRYYRVRHPSWRLTKNEALKLSAAGIEIFTVYEDVGTGLVLTVDQGKADAQNALDQAATVGQPLGSAIYFAVEGLPHGYKKSDLPGIRKYFSGVQSVIGAKYQLGVYSDGVVCQALLDEGICKYTWLSASTSFEGSKDFYRSGRWNLFQQVPTDLDWDGLSVDTNEAKSDFGAFVVPILTS